MEVLSTHVMHSSGLKLEQHAYTPVDPSSGDDGLLLLPSLEVPSSHLPVVVDLSLDTTATSATAARSSGTTVSISIDAAASRAARRRLMPMLKV